MPSYRVSAFVGLLPDVLPAAVDAVRGLVTVEAWDLGVVRGRARVTVRYEADDDQAARRAGWQVLARLDELAEIDTRSVTRRMGNRWVALRV